LKNYAEIKIRVKKPSKHTHLYVISAGNLFKIGVTNNIERRMKALQTGNPCPLQLEYLDERKNPHKAEKYLHLQFQKNHVRGEWFENISLKDIRTKLLLFLDQD
jgi:hypothetical protein